MKSDTSFYEKRHVVLRKTSRCFMKGNLSFDKIIRERFDEKETLLG